MKEWSRTESQPGNQSFAGQETAAARTAGGVAAARTTFGSANSVPDIRGPKSKNPAYREFAQDLSKGGVFIETREPLKVGEKIAMAFSLQDTQSHFKFAGTIVRVEKHGVAIQFDSKLSKYQEEIIRQYLNKK